MAIQGESFPIRTEKEFALQGQKRESKHLSVDVSGFPISGKLVPQWSNYCLSLCCVGEEERVEKRKERVLGEKSISGDPCYQAAFPETRILDIKWGVGARAPVLSRQGCCGFD